MISPTAIEEGSMSPRELSVTIFFVSARQDSSFLNIKRVLSLDKKTESSHSRVLSFLSGLWMTNADLIEA